MTAGTTFDHLNDDACQKSTIILQCSGRPLDKGATDGELKSNHLQSVHKSRPRTKRLTQHKKVVRRQEVVHGMKVIH